MVPIVGALGFTAHATGPSTILTAPSPLIAPDREHELRVVRQHFAGTTARGRFDGVVAVAREQRADVVLCDEVDFGAMLAAEALGIAHVNVVVIASGTFGRPELVAEPLDALRAELGLPPDRSAGPAPGPDPLDALGAEPGLPPAPEALMLSRALVVAPVPRSFRDPTCPLPPDALHLRPAEPRPPAESTRTERARVYVTL